MVAKMYSVNIIFTLFCFYIVAFAMASDSDSEAFIASSLHNLTNSNGLFDDTVLKDLTHTEQRDAVSVLNEILENQDKLKAILENYMRIYLQSHHGLLNSSITPDRLHTFKANLLRIALHNLKGRIPANRAHDDSLFELGVNSFTHMSTAEFQEYVTCISDSLDVSEFTVSPTNQPKSFWDWLIHFTNDWFYPHQPQHVDWTEEGIISPVESQSPCGSCYAFATTTVVEAYFAKLNNRTPIPLSKQQLVDCITDGLGCNGGTLAQAFSHAKTIGLNTETNYPYVAMKQDCKRQNGQLFDRIEAWRTEKGDEGKLANEVALHPVAIGMCFTSLQHYRSGIYSGPTCTTRNHAVVVVGYGVENGVKFWKIKNSYGSWFGESGYFRVRRDYGNLCQVAGAGVVAYKLHSPDLLV